MWVQFIYATFVSNLLITISKYYTYGIGGTWGTFDPRNAREPWDFFKQLYFKNDQGKSYFFAGKSPKSPRIHTRKIYKSLLVNVSSECFSNKSASLSELYSNRLPNAVSLLACADTISFLTL